LIGKLGEAKSLNVAFLATMEQSGLAHLVP